MSDATKICAYCGETILAIARKCRYCGEYLDAAARQQAHAPSAVDRMLVPVGRPGSAIAAGYLGLLSFFPLVGFFTGIAAVACGIMALKAIRADPSLSGKGRAWFGIITGAPMAVVWGLGFVGLVIGLIIESQGK